MYEFTTDGHNNLHFRRQKLDRLHFNWIFFEIFMNVVPGLYFTGLPFCRDMAKPALF